LNIHQTFLMKRRFLMRPYTLKQIQTFLEVARQRSVSKAAERLFVTQPAVSMQIRQLEDAFGVALFEPHGPQHWAHGCRTKPLPAAMPCA
jgi:hypothetical protein